MIKVNLDKETSDYLKKCAAKQQVTPEAMAAQWIKQIMKYRQELEKLK